MESTLRGFGTSRIARLTIFVAMAFAIGIDRSVGMKVDMFISADESGRLTGT